MADNSVDAIVTDPPYELGFMGKSWDSTGVAYDVTVWQECLRVLKPGGHLLAFGGSRTYHRLAVAIEDAGFQIRDQIMWVYGSGFPKSLNIGKAIDKAAGAERKNDFKSTTVRVTANSSSHRGTHICDNCGKYYGSAQANCHCPKSKPATAEAKQWDGWGTALKPAHEPIVMARKPLDGTVANNVLTHGVGGINIDGCRVGNEGGTAKGTFPNQQSTGIYGDGLNGACEIKQLDAGRFPANFIHDGSDEVLELFPKTKSSKTKTNDERVNLNKSMFIDGVHNSDNSYDDSGSAARFFYCAKASKKDRNEGLEKFETVDAGGMKGRSNGSMGSITMNKNHHPTVKPTDLMRYLCRLITPPNGTVLDPFTGSGSTGKAATLEGFNFIGIEQSAEYVEIANARINHAKENK